MKIFLTGNPKVGKSTVLMKIIEQLKSQGKKVGGFVTPEIKDSKKDVRIGFAVRDVYSNDEGTFASKKRDHVPIPYDAKSFGNYLLDLKKFDSIAIPSLDFALKKCDVVVIDEIGTMELFSENFKNKLLEVLASDKHVIATLHRNYKHEYRKFGKIIEVTKENRDRLSKEICDEILLKLFS